MFVQQPSRAGSSRVHGEWRGVLPPLTALSQQHFPLSRPQRLHPCLPQRPYCPTANMSERKVLTKYYPPDFDPSKITRTRGPKQAGPKLQTVRLMAPFSMKCTHCGEFIYKGRKFNARKETTDEKYYNIAIFRFYIRCTRCSGEITFKTDPKNMDYECERGAKRNFEPWREAKLAEETEEERLDRLEREEAERDAMKELETKVLDAKQEMAIADALDEIRSRNARIEKADKEGKRTEVQVDPVDELRKKQDEEDTEAARRAFETRGLPDIGEEVVDEDMFDAPIETPAPVFNKKPKEKKDFTAALGIKKKAAIPPAAAAPPQTNNPVPSKPAALLAGYDSDDD